MPNHDLAKEVALLFNLSTELKAFARSLERGGTVSVNPVPALEAAAESLARLGPLAEFRRAAERCEDRAGSVGVNADEVFAHWLVLLHEGKVAAEGLREHVRAIEWEDVDDRASELAARRAAVCEVSRDLGNPTTFVDGGDELMKEAKKKRNSFLAARAELQTLIGPPHAPFEIEKSYRDEWKRKLGNSEELRKAGKRRGLDPDGAAVKARRNELGWSQRRLIEEVEAETGKELSLRTVRRIEAGRRVDVSTLEAVAKGLRVEADALRF